MKLRTKTIQQTGIVVTGKAILNLWGGGKGQIEMKEIFIPNEKISKTSILKAINDNSFGCVNIEKAEVDIYIHYNNGYLEYIRTIDIDNPIHLQYANKGI